jgi:hypothetical protein
MDPWSGGSAGVKQRGLWSEAATVVELGEVEQGGGAGLGGGAGEGEQGRVAAVYEGEAEAGELVAERRIEVLRQQPVGGVEDRLGELWTQRWRGAEEAGDEAATDAPGDGAAPVGRLAVAALPGDAGDGGFNEVQELNGLGGGGEEIVEGEVRQAEVCERVGGGAQAAAQPRGDGALDVELVPGALGPARVALSGEEAEAGPERLEGERALIRGGSGRAR